MTVLFNGNGWPSNS